MINIGIFLGSAVIAAFLFWCLHEYVNMEDGHDED